MLLASALFCLALAFQDKPAPPDHSGEAKLKELFSFAGSVRGVHLTSEYFYLETAPKRYNESNTTDLWLERGGRFRLASSSNYWGGGGLVVCDGYQMLRDDMSDDGAIRVTKAPKTMHEVDENEPWLYIFEGLRGFDAFVDPAKDIVLTKSKAGDAIDFTSKQLGRILVYYEEVSGAPFPTMYELYKPSPWADDPGDGTMPFTRAKLRLVDRSGIPLRMFSAKPPSGRKVIYELGQNQK